MVTNAAPVHYVAPGWFTRNVFNRSLAWLTRHGISVWGSRILEVRGRRSGEWRSTPVNLHVVDGATYLVAARGETQWVRNLRAATTGRLRLGRTVTDFRANPLDAAMTPDVVRSYLERWGWEVGRFFDGISADATDEDLMAIADRHPVFRLELGDPHVVDPSRVRSQSVAVSSSPPAAPFVGWPSSEHVVNVEER